MKGLIWIFLIVGTGIVLSGFDPPVWAATAKKAGKSKKTGANPTGARQESKGSRETELRRMFARLGENAASAANGPRLSESVIPYLLFSEANPSAGEYWDFERSVANQFQDAEGGRFLTKAIALGRNGGDQAKIVAGKILLFRPMDLDSELMGELLAFGYKTWGLSPVKAPVHEVEDPGVALVDVKGGCFTMGNVFAGGDSDEKPVHEVCVSDYSIGKYEVTQAEWQKVMGNNPSKFMGDRCPVEQVSWDDIQRFITKLNTKTGKMYRLPTEAEWEYAARGGGKDEKFPGTSAEAELGQVAWYEKNSGKTTHPVGGKKPNGLGLYDMSGNVWEWCQDWRDGKYYASSPKENPQGPAEGNQRVLRGGGWLNNVRELRAAGRSGDDPGGRFNSVGFRLVLPSQGGK